MKFSKYLLFSAVDFSTDPFFLEWRWFKTEEACLFWDSFLSRYPEKSEEILMAIEIIEKVIEGDDVSFFPGDKENSIKKLTAKVQRFKRRKKIALYSLSMVGMLFFVYFLPQRHTGETNKVEKKILSEIPGEEKEVQLVLSTGEKASFKEDVQVKYDTTGNIIVQSQSGEMLEKHGSDKSDKGGGELNRLIVPKGKRSSLLLADGSKIWVNSGTVVEFPAVFDGSGDRKITVEGEIYIEVENDSRRPFLISTPDFEVAVLGTKFNVSAYREDPVQHVTVSEGLVSVISSEENQKNIVSKNKQLRIIDKQQAIVTEVDVYNYISWKDGILRFESEPLKNILTRLARYYDLPIEFGKDVETIHCSGKLYLFDEWRTVLDNITKVSPVEYSEIENKIVFGYNSGK